MIPSRLILLTGVPEKSSSEFQKTHIQRYPENHTFYEIMWENMVEPGQATDENMARARCTQHN
jgi:hypothetical protein